MDELDQLLQELSAPKPLEKPAPLQVSQPVQVQVREVEQPKPQTVDFNELDSLMAELGGNKKETPPPQIQQQQQQQQQIPPPQIQQQQIPQQIQQPASKTGASTVDDLLAELSGASYSGSGGNSNSNNSNNAFSQKPPQQQQQQQPQQQQSFYANSTPNPAFNQQKNSTEDLDSVMNALQGLQTTPKSTPMQVGASSRKNELDNILNSLSSEMNQIGVDSDFKGQCSRCKKAILGQVVTALGKTWHPECFGCFQCRKPLGSSSFFEKDSNPYCEKCFHDMFSPKCAYCDGPIRERCINALGKTWHPDHFFCSQCGKNFAGGGGFMEKDGKAYCEEDYFNMFAPKCGGCEKPIMADCITALGRQWHPNCFVCMECRQPFVSGSFFDYEGKPYCEKHYHSQRGSLCASCQKPVLGRCITAIGKRFHPEHFVCAFCMKQLAQGTFKENTGKPYCLGCHVKLFG